MEERFLRDSLERELKRVRQDISAILGTNNEEHNALDSTSLVEELLTKTTQEELNAAGQKWDLPLPIPLELETEQRLGQLLDCCEAIFSGLRLKPAKRLAGNTWELTGEAGIVQFTLEFQTSNGRMTKFELKKFPSECTAEIADLMQLARSRSCLRTWLVGLSEYSFLVTERARAFAEIRSRQPHMGMVENSTKRIETSLDVIGSGGEKKLRLVWRAKWTAIPTSTFDPNEFLVPEIELQCLQGFTEEEKMVVEDGEALSGMIRTRGGVEAAVLLLLESL